MPSFESPLGSKRISGQPMREFDIPDEGEKFAPSVSQKYQMDSASMQEFQTRMQASMDPTSNLSQTEREIREERNARRFGKERLNEGARKRIELLLGMTRLSRSVILGENSFILKSLKSKELSEAYMMAAEFDGTVQSPFEIRRQLLGRSLTEISGISIPQFIGSDSLEDKLIFIDEMDHALLSRLYSEYLLLVEETKEKYAIKNEVEAKEVLEDLKK